MFTLSMNIQCSKECKDGKQRNFVSFYLNDVLLLKQKFPYDETYERGFDRRTLIYDVYLFNGKIYQKRKIWHGCMHPKNETEPFREVSYPVSRKILERLGVPKDLKIYL